MSPAEISPEALALLQAGIDDLQSAVLGFLIQTDDDLVQADAYLSRAKKGRKWVKDLFADSLEAARASCRAADDSKAEILAMIQRFEGPLVGIETSMKGAMTTYEADRRRKQRELAAKAAQEEAEAKERARKAALEAENKAKTGAPDAEKAAAAAFAADFMAAAPAPVVIEPIRPAIKTTFAETWSYEIPDPSQIPRWFLMPDPVKISNLMRERKPTLKMKLDKGEDPITLSDLPGVVFLATVGARGKAGT